MGMERRDQGHELVRGRIHDYVDWCLLLGGQRWGERQSGFLSEDKVAEFSILQNRKPRRGTDLGKTTNLLLERLSLRCRRWLYPSVPHPRDLPTGLPKCPHNMAANFPPSGQCTRQAATTVSFMTKLQNRTLSFRYILLVTQVSPIQCGRRLHKDMSPQKARITHVFKKQKLAESSERHP